LKNYIRSKFAVILVLLVLLPAAFYFVHQYTTLSEGERLIEEIYRRQLDVVLFSVNQYAWDIAGSWTLEIERLMRMQSQNGTSLEEFLRLNRSINAVVILDTNGLRRFIYTSGVKRSSVAGGLTNETSVHTSLTTDKQRITRLIQLYRSKYRKMEAVAVDSSGENNKMALFFIGEYSPNHLFVAGIVLDVKMFITETLAKKLNEAAGTDFNLAVFSNAGDRLIFSTGSVNPNNRRQSKQLWLLPSYSIAIQMRETTIEGLARERFNRSMTLLIIVNAVVVIGVIVMYRSVRREIELARLKSDFVSNVSHELRTPLSLIRMFGETLQMNRIRSEEQRQEYYETIVRETDRLSRLVNKVLDFSRMESGRKEFQLVPTNLSEIVKTTIERYASYLKSEGFVVTCSYAEHVPMVSADAAAVQDALFNLLDNAAKYSDVEKRITVETKTDAHYVYIEVEDRGIGIAMEHQKRIFDKFYRVSGGLVHKTKGSGLGLALVQGIMDAHHGKITVESAVGKGTKFRLWFPLTT
jgi:two-component system phosphate regulon sensor histidine kinase PhoR